MAFPVDLGSQLFEQLTCFGELPIVRQLFDLFAFVKQRFVGQQRIALLKERAEHLLGDLTIAYIDIFVELIDEILFSLHAYLSLQDERQVLDPFHFLS